MKKKDQSGAPPANEPTQDEPAKKRQRAIDEIAAIARKRPDAIDSRAMDLRP